jgi:formiminotetrahydrofolate cyclodeaminase
VITSKFYHRAMAGLEDQPLGRLLGFVAASDPAPGGGSSAAVAAALGAALLEMTAGLADEPEIAARAAELRAAALELADRELASYAPVLEAMRLPESPERADRIAEALAEASQTPLAIAEAAAEAAQLGAQVSAASKPAIRGDALAGVLIAESAAIAAASLVEVNLAGGEGPDLARGRDARRRAEEARADALATLPRRS